MWYLKVSKFMTKMLVSWQHYLNLQMWAMAYQLFCITYKACILVFLSKWLGDASGSDISDSDSVMCVGAHPPTRQEMKPLCSWQITCYSCMLISCYCTGDCTAFCHFSFRTSNSSIPLLTHLDFIRTFLRIIFKCLSQFIGIATKCHWSGVEKGLGLLNRLITENREF